VSDSLSPLVAVLYHRRGLAQNEIARRLGLSAMKVSRLLQRARETGLVRTEVTLPFTVLPESASRLAAAFGLENALVVGVAAGEEPAEVIGRAWAFTFSAGAAGDAVLGLGLGATVGHAIRELPAQSGAAAHVVQLIGGLPGVGAGNPFSIIQEACRKLGADGTFLSSNALSASRQSRDQFLASPAGQRCARMWSACTELVFGVGSLAGGGYLSPELVTAEETASLGSQGVVGDILGHCFDAGGTPVPTPLGQRLVSIPLDALKRIARRTALAGDPRKLAALRAALRTGLITELVTDEHTAEVLMNG
jgi:DNA-binding transcriptional regulator LsrR (DeoR family)